MIWLIILAVSVLSFGIGLIIGALTYEECVRNYKP